MKNKKYTTSRIPDFKTVQEEAEWWDTHDITDHLDELTVLDRKDVRFAKNLSDNLTVRLSPELLVRLRGEAARKGIGPSTLARMWIMEHLQMQESNQVQGS